MANEVKTSDTILAQPLQRFIDGLIQYILNFSAAAAEKYNRKLVDGEERVTPEEIADSLVFRYTHTITKIKDDSPNSRKKMKFSISDEWKIESR